MAKHHRLTFRTVYCAAVLTLALACDSAVADGFVILDGSALNDDVVTHLDARAPGHLHIGTRSRIDGPAGVLVLDVAATQPSDLAPRVTGYAYPQGILCGPIVAPDGSFFTLGIDGRITARDAAGAVTFTSQEVGGYASDTLALQPDGKVLIGSTRYSPGLIQFPEEWILSRLNPDGTLDASFQGGQVHRDPSPDDEGLAGLAVGPDGKIVVSGPHDGGAEHLTLVGKFFADGVSDFSFGTTGGTVPLAKGSNELQVDSSQRVYVRAGDRLVTRLLEDGSLDSAYAGILPTMNFTVTGMLLDSRNRIVLFGRRGTAGWLARFTPSGDPDLAFGTAGTGEVDVTFPRALATGEFPCTGSLQPDDKPVLACTVEGISDAFMFATDVAVARFNTDGTLDISFGAGPDADTYPDSFSFLPATAPYGTAAYIVSNSVTITGINVSKVSIGGSAYSVGCTNDFTSANGSVASGQTICVRVRASSQPGGVTQASLNVGGRASTFMVTASYSPADSIPDSFTFADQTGVALNTVIESARINVTGLTGFATSTVSGGSQSFNCEPIGFTTEPIVVSEGGTICVHQTSSNQYSTAVNTVLTINGVSDTFTSTTQASPPPSVMPTAPSSSGGGGALDGILAMMLACLVAGVSARRRAVDPNSKSIFSCVAERFLMRNSVLIPFLLADAIASRKKLNFGDGFILRRNERALALASAVRRFSSWMHLRTGATGRAPDTRGRARIAESVNIDLVRKMCTITEAAFTRSPKLREKLPKSSAAWGESTTQLITFMRDRPGHGRRYEIDYAKLERELGFSASRRDDGLGAAFEWFMENESWWRAIMDGSYEDWIDVQYARGA